MMDAPFVHLHVHSEFSLSDGLMRIQHLVEAAAKKNMSALAITEDTNLFSWVRFYSAAIAAGVKPIVGAELDLKDDDLHSKEAHRILLLCENQKGYHHLSQLLSQAYLHGQAGYDRAVLTRQWLAENREGLIVLLGRESRLGTMLASQKTEHLGAELDYFSYHFPKSWYLEIRRVGQVGEKAYNQQVLRCASQHQIAVVASNDVRFLTPDDMMAHEARVCIAQGRILDDPKRPKHYTAQQYLRSPDEMQALFADLPVVLENSVEISKRCHVSLTFDSIFLPHFEMPNDVDLKQFFKAQAQEGLDKRLAQMNASDTSILPADYKTRLAMELSVLNKMEYAGYFLIVADFVRWAKTHDISVGPGRGSGAGSLVAYALGITNVDPLKYQLLFERFLNPERVSMPDFDIDFCVQGRDRVIEYVSQRYGKDKVAQIITFGSMAAKAVVRDVGRVMGYPYGFVDTLAKLVPFAVGMTLKKALNDEPRLSERYASDAEARTLIDLALKLEGTPRHAGKHAGGVVIAPSKLTDFTPLYCESEGGSVVTQFDKDDIEKLGLVKFDFLGLRTLTIIRWTIDTACRVASEKGEAIDVDIDQIPLNDVNVFQLLQEKQTLGVFQLESHGIRELSSRLKPTCFGDIVALVALYRPGPLQSGMVDDFMDRKHGLKEITYLHPALEPILQDTYGVMLYQEQVMQIAQNLAGYSLGEADLLRRAMGKKKVDEMARHRQVFVTRATKNSVSLRVATTIFDLMEKFAGYGFNKSHSVAYALISYQTAWLKVHYPAAFMAAVLSSDMDNTGKIVVFVREAQRLGLVVHPPHINQCQHRFTVDRAGAIQYGLGAIKGVGEAAIVSIIEARQQKGAFCDLIDFCLRVDLRKVNRRVLEALVKAGSFDTLHPSRAQCLGNINRALQYAEQCKRDRAAGQRDFFKTDHAMLLATPVVGEENLISYDDTKRLRDEKAVLGWYLTGHPVQMYEKELNGWGCKPFAEQKEGSIVSVAGCITRLKVKTTRRGDKMAFGDLEDATGLIEILFFADVYKAYDDHLALDQVVVVEGELGKSRYNDKLCLVVQRLYPVATIRTQRANHLNLTIDWAEDQFEQKLSALMERLKPYRGGTVPIVITRRLASGQCVRLRLGKDWCIHPEDALLSELRCLLREDRCRLVYPT